MAKYKPEPKVVYPQDMKDNYVPNEVIVDFWRMPPSLEDFAKKYHAKVINVNKYLFSATFKTSNMTEFLKSVSKDPYVCSAYPRGYGEYSYAPNDPHWNQQWGPKKIFAPEAWDYQKGSTSIIVAVLDSGVDYNHEDLAGRVVKGYDFVNDDYDPMDDHHYSHGTHVAGIIGAIVDNNRGIAGIAQVKILAIKVGDRYRPYPDNVADGIYYAANNSAKIISMSLSFNSDYERVRRACEYA